MPDIHAAEVGAARIWVANPLHYGHFAVVENLLEGCRVGVESQLIAYRQHLVLGDYDHRSAVVVDRIVVRDQSIHEIVPAGQLNDDENRGFTVCCHLCEPPGV